MKESRPGHYDLDQADEFWGRRAQGVISTPRLSVANENRLFCQVANPYLALLGGRPRTLSPLPERDEMSQGPVDDVAAH